MLGRAPKMDASADDQPQLPLELAYLWGYFAEIAGGVAVGGFGPAVVTWGDIGWWSMLMRITLEPWEARTLVQLSVIRANVLTAETKKPAPGAKP